MPQRNIAHRFQLHAFQIEVEQSALEGRRQAMGIIDLEELELNIEVVWTALQAILKDANPIDQNRVDFAFFGSFFKDFID